MKLTPVASHDTADVAFVDLGGRVEVPDVERVQVMVLRSEEQDGW
jgi:hypothetical protein